MTEVRKSIQLIVNADDYGYFPGISRGILDAAASGALTATGILANSPDLKVQLKWLAKAESLSVGVHLNLTHGKPLTASMAEKLGRWQGQFPDAYVMTRLLLTGQIKTADVRAEWCAQIAACQGCKLMFLNSHEHIHMLPLLFPLALELAEQYRIAHVRLTRAEWLFPQRVSGLVRNTLMQIMQTVNQSASPKQTPIFLGLGQSGKLDLAYLSKIFARLQPGKTYELMCHPGYRVPGEIMDPKLLGYHDWEAELALLQSRDLRDLYKNFGIRLQSY